ncbi:DUF4974 domain-containing protein [Chitinophaga agrisoli]|uniref:DUF4974 domain-containing protein n=1 Tax=Chitinophaga agrisoli TaxID=2607653 RepID=A0A5B2VYX5_9BACT|nr:FecR domain-containing protein [Chitinophaga agrisoli]KAA2243199.1 DUF4974 domain-containing protein [Chitinophaga agrisoli]
MKNNELKNLIDKYLDGALNAEETAQLEQWLDGMAADDAFAAMPEQEKETARTEGYNRLVKRIEKAQRPTIVKRMFTGARSWKIAAAVACLVITGTLFKNSLLDIVAPHRLTAMQSTEGRIKKHILSDGSIVWLKGNSKLVFPVSFGEGNRVVTLEGEALFEVAKDAAHPFQIQCGSLTTTVLGTSFNIRSSGNETHVAVLTGKIALSAPQSGKVILYPNQQAIYKEAAVIARENRNSASVHEITKGTEYDMAFNDVRMSEVVQRIEKKFEVNIALQDAAITGSLITADFTDQSLQNTMEMICQALNLDVEINGKSISLKLKKES